MFCSVLFTKRIMKIVEVDPEKSHASGHNTEKYNAIWRSGHNFDLLCPVLRVCVSLVDYYSDEIYALFRMWHLIR